MTTLKGTQLTLNLYPKQFKTGQLVTTPDGQGRVYYINALVWDTIGGCARPYNKEDVHHADG